MEEFISKQSKVLSDYESHKTFLFRCYVSGVYIKTTQDEVVKSDGEVKNHSALITTFLKNNEAIELRDYLLANYPIEA
mgnify:CR=1 FL=1